MFSMVSVPSPSRGFDENSDIVFSGRQGERCDVPKCVDFSFSVLCRNVVGFPKVERHG